MDAQRFDRLIKTLSATGTRRALLTLLGTLPVASALGLSEGALAKKARRHGGTATAETCISSGRKCPSKKPRGKSGRDLTCKQCCQDFSVSHKDQKGKTVRRCACKPVGLPCTDRTAAYCCSGVCVNAICVSPPGPGQTCTGLNQPCTANAECCTGVCNVGGTTTGPRGNLANTCQRCVAAHATCSSGFAPCCGGECTQAPGGTGRVCESDSGEQCFADQDATATDPKRGTCSLGNFICPVAGNTGPLGVCCTRSGSITLGPSQCPGAAGECCTGACFVDMDQDRCCAPGGADPRVSGGDACVAGEANASCCSESCNGAAPGACL